MSFHTASHQSASHHAASHHAAPHPHLTLLTAASTFDPDVESFAPAPSFGSLYADGATWKDEALCAETDPEAFFPEKGGSTREAKRVCAGCSVQAECLQYALDNDERFGIWGGLSERERRRLRLQQRTLLSA